jgi:putative endonuclease
MYYIYVLHSRARDEYYLGFSHDPWFRLHEHNHGLNKSTKGRIWELVYVEGYVSESYARNRECVLKRNRRMNKFLMDRVKNSVK